MDALTRIIKQAGQASPNPEAEAMEAAAHQATGPASMPLIKMPKPGEEEKGADEGKDTIRMAHELDSKSKEINGLRQQLQEAKFDTMRTQLKADIAQEQTRMREFLRKEQQQMHDKLRDEQKQLDARQSQLKMQEAEIKANNIAEQADHKAKISIEEAQHRAQLDSDVSAHDAEIAQRKADSLMDIAKQTTDMYVKQTEKARTDADKYFADRDKAFKANHPAISPALQSTMNAAMSSVGRVGKSLQKMQVDAPLQKMALMQEGGPDIINGRTYGGPSPTVNTPAPDPTRPSPGAMAGEASRFQKWMPADANNLTDYAKAIATQENELARMRGEGASRDEIKAFQQMHAESKANFESLRKRTEAAAKAGDAKAKEMMAQYGDLNDDSGAWWWYKESDLDKLRHQYKNQKEEEGHGWLYRTARGVGHMIDFIGGTAEQEAQRRQADRMYARRGLSRTMMGGEGKTDAERAAYNAVTSRGLNSGWGRDALEISGQAALDGLTLAGTVATAGTAGAALRGGALAGKALATQAAKQGLKTVAKQTAKKPLTGAIGEGMSKGWQAGRQAVVEGGKKGLLGANGQIARTGRGIWEGTKGAVHGAGQELLNSRNAIANAKGFWGTSKAIAAQPWKAYTTAGKVYGRYIMPYALAYKPIGAIDLLQGTFAGTGGSNYMNEDGSYRQMNRNMYYLNRRGNVDMYNGQQLNGQTGEIEDRPSPMTMTEYLQNLRANGYGMQKASGVQNFLEKWAAPAIAPGPSKATPEQNKLTPKPFKTMEKGDREAYQHDPYFIRKTTQGAYSYPWLNFAAPIITGLTGLTIHPQYNWFANQQERWDPFDYQMKVKEAYDRHMASLTRNPEHMSDMGAEVTDAWARHVGADRRYGSNYVAPWV